MTINITPEITTAYDAYLDETIDWDFHGKPIHRRASYQPTSIVDFAAGYQAALYRNPIELPAPEPLLQQIAAFGELQNQEPQARELSEDEIRAVYKKLWPSGPSIKPGDVEFARAVLAARDAS